MLENVGQTPCVCRSKTTATHHLAGERLHDNPSSPELTRREDPPVAVPDEGWDEQDSERSVCRPSASRTESVLAADGRVAKTLAPPAMSRRRSEIALGDFRECLRLCAEVGFVPV